MNSKDKKSPKNVSVAHYQRIEDMEEENEDLSSEDLSSDWDYINIDSDMEGGPSRYPSRLRHSSAHELSEPIEIAEEHETSSSSEEREAVSSSSEEGNNNEGIEMHPDVVSVREELSIAAGIARLRLSHTSEITRKRIKSFFQVVENLIDELMNSVTHELNERNADPEIIITVVSEVGDIMVNTFENLAGRAADCQGRNIEAILRDHQLDAASAVRNDIAHNYPNVADAAANGPALQPKDFGTVNANAAAEKKVLEPEDARAVNADAAANDPALQPKDVGTLNVDANDPELQPEDARAINAHVVLNGQAVEHEVAHTLNPNFEPDVPIAGAVLENPDDPDRNDHGAIEEENQVENNPGFFHSFFSSASSEEIKFTPLRDIPFLIVVFLLILIHPVIGFKSYLLPILDNAMEFIQSYAKAISELLP